MNRFQPLRYLKKYTAVIAGVFVFLTLVLYAVLSFFQTFTASIVIEFVYDGAENGLAPDGTKLVTSDIYSSSVISQALTNLGLDQGKYPVDKVRSSITVRELTDESVDLINEAKNEEGEISDLRSTKYEISYKVKSSDGEELAQQMLDEILDVYLTEFSKTYINTSSVVNSTSMVNQGVYDYIEQIELIENALKDTITSLSQRARISPYFYSSNTGWSFNELVNEFSLLQRTQVSSLYSYILQHRVTKAEDVLLDKYRERVQANQREQTQYEARISEVEGILEAYVRKLRESDNTAQSNVITDGNGVLKNNNVLGDVESPNYTTEENEWIAYDQTTEYEKLLQNWIDISDQYNNSVSDEEYSQYVIDCFSGNTEAVTAYQERVSRMTNESGTDTEIAMADEAVAAEAIQAELSADVYTEGTVPCTQADIDYVEAAIDDLVSKMDSLYEVTFRTDNEYNEYLGAEYIQSVSSNHLTKGINVLLYTGIGAVLFLGIGCCGVIFIGRLGDMIEYVAFTDHQYHMPNRSACDRYIHQYRDKIMPAGFGCVLVQILNSRELNQRLGRKGGDALIGRFAELLKAMFGSENSFVGYNGSGQFLIFLPRTTLEEARQILENVNVALTEAADRSQSAFQYSAGIAVSSKTELHQIRELISAAAKQKEQYDVGSKK